MTDRHLKYSGIASRHTAGVDYPLKCKLHTVNRMTVLEYRMSDRVTGQGENDCLLDNTQGSIRIPRLRNCDERDELMCVCVCCLIYDLLQLCKYQCWAAFLTANDGLGFGIIMTDQHWIIHLRVLKYAITLRCVGSIHHGSQRYAWKKAARHNRTAIDSYGPFMFCCCCCLSWLKKHRGRKISQVLKFPPQ